MRLAKKLLVCKKCGAGNPDHAMKCRSCSSTLRGAPANDSRAAREKSVSARLTDSAEERCADAQRSIWPTQYRGRLALNLFLIALFAFILVMNLSTDASALSIAVVLVFLALSTTRFFYTWRMAKRGDLAQ